MHFRSINVKTLSAVTVISFFSIKAQSQGCSDAGFCSINSFKPAATELQQETGKNQFRAGVSAGSADYDISVYSIHLEYSRQINRSWRIDTKIAMLSQNGNGIHTTGLSDIFINANYAASDRIDVIAGVKIPLSDAGKTKDGLPLPMDYQSSLGTFDLIAGVAYKVKKWKFNLGWQQPLSQNSNSFIAENYPSHSPLHGLQSTRNYIRKGDVLMRIAYTVPLSRKLTLVPGLLPIYHLADDEFTNLNGKQIIHGSKGLTLNVTGLLQYTMNEKNTLELNLGSPVVARDVRPDGLTRSFVATLQYQFTF
jgi:hypothetical protein